MKKNILTNSSAFLFILLFLSSLNINAQDLPSNIITGADQPKFHNVLPDPAVIDATNGGTYNMYMAEREQELGIYEPDLLPYNIKIPLETDVWGYGTSPGNVTYPGPTFLAKKNKKIKVTWRNNLPYNHLLPVDESLHWANPESGIATVTHLHGGHTESASDGLPEAWFTQDFEHKGPYFVKEKYEYKNDQEAATLWYHDHALGITRLNVYAGLAGFYFLRDKNELDMIEDFVIPGGDYEREIVIQDRLFVKNGGKAQLYFPSQAEDGGEGDCGEIPGFPEVIEQVPNPSVLAEFFTDEEDTDKLFMIVNGVAWPKLDVEPRKYRFRLLNGSDSRFYVLEFHDDENWEGLNRTPEGFLQIGTDDGFLENPVSLSSLVIAPGERMDVVMDFTGLEGQSIWLKNFGPDEPYGGGKPYTDFVPADESTTRDIMRFDVGTTSNPNIPNASVNLGTSLRPTIPTLNPNGPTRKLVLFEGRDEYCRLKPMLGTVNEGSLLWDEPITENPGMNKTEIWEIYNATADAHPIHLHLVSFQIINREGFELANQEEEEEEDLTYSDPNDLDMLGLPRLKLKEITLSGNPTAPPPNEDGWKDTGIVEPGQVMRVIAKFDKGGRYVWHCHILSHEDHEMMRPFYVGNIPNNYFPITDGGFDAMEKETFLQNDLGGPVILTKNQPNPFSNSTEIGYTMSDDANISIMITDLNGKVVKTLVNGFQNAGSNYVTWDGTDQSGSLLPNGLYTCILRSEDGIQAIKMMILR